MASSKQVFYGETQCASAKCSNRAYWRVGSRYICGVHSRSSAGRVALKKNPNAAAERAARLKTQQAQVEAQAAERKQAGRKGRVIVTKLRMRKAVEHNPGFLKVFPNFRHGGRKDGYGCPALSPMSLGPVLHGQPGLKPCMNLENLHQGNKVFPSETKRDGKEVNILPAFFKTQRKLYADKQAHRHKPQAKEKDSTGRRVVPLFSVWTAKTGDVRRYSYVQSRYFYCHFYELLASRTAELAHLRRLMDNGTSLQIVGYDGYSVQPHDTLQSLYEDRRRPFGHEMVLYSMLVERDPLRYPWNVYRRSHPALYAGCCEDEEEEVEAVDDEKEDEDDSKRAAQAEKKRKKDKKKVQASRKKQKILNAMLA